MDLAPLVRAAPTLHDTAELPMERTSTLLAYGDMLRRNGANQWVGEETPYDLSFFLPGTYSGGTLMAQVVLDRAGYALYFSRAPIPYARDAFANGVNDLPTGLPVYRHVGIYAYRASFLLEFRTLDPVAIERFEALEQLRALAYGYRISVAITRSRW